MPLGHPSAAPISLNGNHQILQNCSQSLRLNSIFEITNEIWQQLTHKCCLFCSNSVKKTCISQARSASVQSPTRTSNGSCSDALTLPISECLFCSESRALLDRAAILRVFSFEFFPIQNYMSDTSWVFYSLCPNCWPGRASLRLRKQQANQKRGSWILIRQAKIDLF